MRGLMLGLTMAAVSTMAMAGGADGIWKTVPGADGGHLEVTIGPCSSDATKTCGTISKAFTKQGVDPGYVNMGKLMIKDMTSSDSGNYAGGTIWDPENDKIYKAKMRVEGDTLDVDGCVSIFCSEQKWTRVK